MFKTNEAGQAQVEPFAEEAKFFVETRLLQREVKIIMEGVSNQNILGTVLHPVCTIFLNIYLYLLVLNFNLIFTLKQVRT